MTVDTIPPKRSALKKAPKIARVPRETQKLHLGWREWVAIPELGVSAVKAKVDTGARSSSLHAEDVLFFEEEGKTYVQFVLGGGKRRGKLHRAGETICRALLVDLRWITSSNGIRQRRPVIRVAVHLHEQSWPVDLTLSSRGSMGFPMLLGREAVRGRFVVDPARSYLSKEHLPRKK